MSLIEEIKQKIHEDYDSCKETMYGNLTKEQRKKLGAFYTPPELVIKMIEEFDDLNDDIVDPCCGIGLLLSGCIIAGADPKRCFGIEINEDQAERCRDRLEKYGVPRDNIITGSCLDEDTWGKLRCL